MWRHNNISKRGRGIFYGWILLAAAFVILVVGYAIRNTFSVGWQTAYIIIGLPKENTVYPNSSSDIHPSGQNS